jgi:hypothetical protein
MNATMTELDPITDFSTLKMFGHLFDLQPGLEKRLKSVEHIAQKILELQLRPDPEDRTGPSKAAIEVMLKTELEQSLSFLFSPESPFWENYYARQHRVPNEKPAKDNLFAASPDEIRDEVRNRYPVFYTVLDALYYSEPSRHHEYMLIELSLQSYLEGIFLQQYGFLAESKIALSNASRLLGPIRAAGYLQYLLDVMR